MTETEDQPTKPAYRYLEPLPHQVASRALAASRWVLMVALALWVLVFLGGFVVCGALR